MVQLKYYGDSRDYFKYDLISFVLSNDIFISYCFVPMLTNNRFDNEGGKKLKHSVCKSTNLYNFINNNKNPDLNHWEKWLKQFVPVYKTIQPVNSTYFTDQNRSKYWELNREILVLKNALIFLDPDTGIQAGRKTIIGSTDREKYILNEDLVCLLGYLSDSSMYVIYQHLQRNRNKHIQDIERKLTAFCNFDPEVFVRIYFEDDLAFLFATKNFVIYSKVKTIIDEYCSRSTIKHKGAR
jgi:hypothetical protein